ncbi:MULTISPECIES: glucosaminidase domain-containing protein [unclassified Colwellia]|uniref:glucosaminidase domain-containing protein n=1 Tax=unclassified Colwellia TaxID=196834 RepID=UPI0015F6F963|nr:MULTISPECIES: glucosaminidase domain-containing protein [unclassified Colwellia]MBA6231597.1 glucosaminidase domain-containing protein [Colwellia sp. MB02u-7]MBA6235461.1 glucosaminidase domain-containing protein [Colwellia sp. MB02u-11]MBA6254583.1 glucosaminidase domain-containing protein [Colwellia sp. MB3u-28]MBA6259973.1 glucosaminidase domain-containing protein [Colwellia sp. MB3u-41]MBA6299839.1 glucosaminidase domain-containing protein [Colwellia sp. MB3u-22]
MKLTALQSKILLALFSLLLLSVAIYFYSAKEVALPKMTVQEKKARFKNLIIPAVNEVYDELTVQYLDVSESLISGSNNDMIERLKIEYKAESDNELLMALKPHPKSIAIAQAAMESSWATSRFFNEANNIFGVWSFDKDEPRIAALKKRGDKTIWLKKYPSVKASVKDYYRTLGRSAAFEKFRQLRLKTDNPFSLVKRLDRYSEKGAEYGEELTSIIKFNDFNSYDE